MDEQLQNKGASKKKIILATIICWPWGLYLWYRKASYQFPPKNSAVLAWYWVFATFFTFFYFGIGLIPLGLFSLFSGCAVVIKYVGVVGRVRRFRIHMDSLGDKHITNINQLAQRGGCSYERCLKDLVKMMELGYLSGRIDEEKRLFALHGINCSNVVFKRAPKLDRAQVQTLKEVACQHCGASNEIFDLPFDCEYCGKPLA